MLGSQRDVRIALGAILLLEFVVLTRHVDQPIVENYVGRQVPTAMVARDLERGGGFLRPSLDVAPLPNLFLVEPPLYAEAVVLVRRLSGLTLSASGRVVSALGVVLGAWGLFGLAASRDGPAVGLAAAAAFVCFPVTIRYGRAFQPDALMVGCLVAGVRCWDGFERGGRRAWLAAACLGLTLGLMLKVVSVSILAVVGLGVVRRPRPWKLVLLGVTLLPALAWYAYAAGLLSQGEGSRASADNAGVWLGVLAPSALVRGETYANVARFLGVRSFTPLGPILAVLGFLVNRESNRLWLVWGGAVLMTMTALAAKLHHEYYWLALGPLMAVGVAKCLVVGANAWSAQRTLQGLGAGAFLVLCGIGSASTWKVPAEWRSLAEAAAAVRAVVPPEALLVAPEALLYESDRRGCRVEFTEASARRAAREWGLSSAGEVDGPISLVEFYRRQGASYFADVVPDEPDARRLALHEAVRRRYNVVVETPGVFVASLTVPLVRPSCMAKPHPPAEPASPVTIPDFARWKQNGRKISMLTAYDYLTARLLDASGVDCLLVGDSLGTVVQGWETTLRVTLDQIVYHAEMVARAARRALVVADLPFGTYEGSVGQALASATRCLKETQCQAVKLEGGRRAAGTVKALVEAGIPVMGHVGLTPQSVRKLGGFKVQRDAAFLLDEAGAVAEAGAFAVVLECVPGDDASHVTETLSIPTIGIGAGVRCDGQVLVTPDMLGLFEGFRPKFVRRYAELGEAVRQAAAKYVGDVAEGRFPADAESFH